MCSAVGVGRGRERGVKGLKRPKGFEGESEGMWEGEEKRVEEASESRLRWESFARWGGVEEAGEESKMSRWRLRDVRIVCFTGDRL